MFAVDKRLQQAFLTDRLRIPGLKPDPTCSTPRMTENDQETAEIDRD